MSGKYNLTKLVLGIHISSFQIASSIYIYIALVQPVRVFFQVTASNTKESFTVASGSLPEIGTRIPAVTITVPRCMKVLGGLNGVSVVT